MAIHVNIGDAKARLSELCAAASLGEDVVLQKAGVPKWKIVSIEDLRALAPEQMAAKRRAALGFFALKYKHLHRSDALDLSPSMTDAEVEERYLRKFGAPAS